MNDDTPCRLPVPYLHDPEMQRHERSWTLIAGSRRLSFTRVDHYAVSRPHRAIADVAPVRQWSLMGAIAIVLGSVAGVATLGLAMNASRAATGHYMLSVVVPAKTPFREDRRAPASGRPVQRQPLVEVPTTPVLLTVMVGPIDAEVLPADAPAPLRLEALQPAVDAALKTGTMQQWTSTDGMERGFVVAGPAEQGCRTLSILTRRDGGNEVKTRRECAAETSDQAATP